MIPRPVRGGAVNFIPDSFATFYGKRPIGAAVFARLGFERSSPANISPARAEHTGH